MAAAHSQGGGTVLGGECIGWTLHLFWGEGTEQGDTDCDMGVEVNGGWGQRIMLVRIMGGKCVWNSFKSQYWTKFKVKFKGYI